MADVQLFKAGTPVHRYMWCEDNYAQFTPPFGVGRQKMTPPYNSHVDGAYRVGHFTLGMPVCPNGVGMEWQRKALKDNKPAVGDIIRLIVVPEDHFCTAINFKIVDQDARLAGAAVALTAETVSYDPATNTATYTEIDDVKNALAAQGLAATVAVDRPVNVMCSLLKLVGGTAGDDGAVSGGYVVPLYAKPFLPAADKASGPTAGLPIALGLKVMALPTDPDMTFDVMRTAWYLSAKIQGFECPTYY